MKILITGATGFIGRQLTLYLFENTDAILCLAIRKRLGLEQFFPHSNRVQFITIGDITANTNWRQALSDCDVVIHLAARLDSGTSEFDVSLLSFRQTNVNGTLNLAAQAVEAGVRRFIYLSSIKVNGEQTAPGHFFSPEDSPAPIHPYGISKYEAEKLLMSLTEKSLMQTVIIRPPLVYGPGVKGNFLRILHLLNKTLPLPFGAIKNNKRSLVSLNNLVNFIFVAMLHPDASNQIFLISDTEDLSTTELFLKIRMLLDKRPLFLPISPLLLGYAATIFKKEAEMQRLTGSLQLDVNKALHLLRWKPVESVDQALRETVSHYLKAEGIET